MGVDAPADDEYTFRYTPGKPCEPSVTICHAVAWVKGVDVAEIEPLARVIDPGALNDLFGATDRSREFDRSASGRDAPTLSFEYEGCTVTVESGRVAVATGPG